MAKRGSGIKMAKTKIINGSTPGTGYKKPSVKNQLKNGYSMGTPSKRVTKVK